MIRLHSRRGSTRNGVRVGRLAALAGVMLLSVWSSAAGAQGRVLERRRIILDDQPAAIKPLVLHLNDYMVPLGQAVRVLTGGKAQPDRDTAKLYTIRYEGKPVIQLPIDPSAGSLPIVNGRQAAGYAYSRPQWLELPGGQRLLMVNLETITALLGITMDVDDAQISLFTPEYWCRQLGLNPQATEGRTFKNLGLIPEMGISPPAKRLLIWLRPPARVYAQIYKLSGGAPEPMLGWNDFVQTPVTQPRGGVEKERVWESARDRPVRVQTQFYGLNGEKLYGSYVAVMSRRDTQYRNLIEAINSGELAPDEFAVVGLRQSVRDSLVLYEPYDVKPGDTVASVALRYRMAEGLLRTLNGLSRTDTLRGVQMLVVMTGFDEARVRQAQQVNYEVVGMYEVQPGENVETLAQRCGVTAQEFRNANAMAIPLNEPVRPGDLVWLVKPLNQPPPPTAPQPNITGTYGISTTNRTVTLRQNTSSPNAPAMTQVRSGERVVVLGQTRNRQYAMVGTPSGVTGYVPSNTISRPTLVNIPTTGQGMHPTVVEALKWERVVSYVWGGNRLEPGGGVDCSHFVANVFARVREPVPSPPVRNMQNFGNIVHIKQGTYERFGRQFESPQTVAYLPLQSGDRVIFQSKSSYHTGIYIGNFRGMQHALIHCNSTHNTVTVDPMLGRYLGGIYRYTVRGANRAADAMDDLQWLAGKVDAEMLARGELIPILALEPQDPKARKTR